MKELHEELKEEFLLNKEKAEGDRNSIAEIQTNLDINIWKLENSLSVLEAEEKKARARIESYKSQLDIKKQHITSLTDEAENLMREQEKLKAKQHNLEIEFDNIKKIQINLLNEREELLADSEVVRSSQQKDEEDFINLNRVAIKLARDIEGIRNELEIVKSSNEDKEQELQTTKQRHKYGLLESNNIPKKNRELEIEVEDLECRAKDIKNEMMVLKGKYQNVILVASEKGNEFERARERLITKSTSRLKDISSQPLEYHDNTRESNELDAAMDHIKQLEAENIAVGVYINNS